MLATSRRPRGCARRGARRARRRSLSQRAHRRPASASPSRASPGCETGIGPLVGAPRCCTTWVSSCASSASPSLGAGPVLALAEVDVAAGRERARRDRPGQRVGARVGVDADVGQRVARPRLDARATPASSAPRRRASARSPPRRRDGRCRRAGFPRPRARASRTRGSPTPEASRSTAGSAARAAPPRRASGRASSCPGGRAHVRGRSSRLPVRARARSLRVPRSTIVGAPRPRCPRPSAPARWGRRWGRGRRRGRGGALRRLSRRAGDGMLPPGGGKPHDGRRVRGGREPGRVLTVPHYADSDETQIGHNQSADIVLTNQHISPHHARVRLDGGHRRRPGPRLHRRHPPSTAAASNTPQVGARARRDAGRHRPAACSGHPRPPRRCSAPAARTRRAPPRRPPPPLRNRSPRRSRSPPPEPEPEAGAGARHTPPPPPPPPPPP